MGGEKNGANNTFDKLAWGWESCRRQKRRKKSKAKNLKGVEGHIPFGFETQREKPKSEVKTGDQKKKKIFSGFQTRGSKRAQVIRETEGGSPKDRPHGGQKTAKWGGGDGIPPTTKGRNETEKKEKRVRTPTGYHTGYRGENGSEGKRDKSLVG